MRPRSRTLLTILVACGALLASGCGRQYPEVSPKAYSIATALHNVTDRKSDAGLDKIEELITTAVDASEITESEADMLRDIVAEARNGNWSDAKLKARQLMADQTDL